MKLLVVFDDILQSFFIFSCFNFTGDKCQHLCSDTDPAPPIQSGFIHTKQAFAFKFGRIEIRARNPTGDWLWPCIFLTQVN